MLLLSYIILTLEDAKEMKSQIHSNTYIHTRPKIGKWV